MRTYTSVLLVATVATVASAQSVSDPPSSSLPASSSMSAELAAIDQCTTTQLDAAQAILTSNQREQQCETALNLTSGTMLQVTTASATEMCGTASCRAALQELYNVLPNCRYDLWGLQYSARQLLEYCGITPSNTTEGEADRRPAGWSVNSDPGSFTPVGANSSAESSPSAPSTVSATSSRYNTATAMITASAVMATTAGLVAAMLA